MSSGFDFVHHVDNRLLTVSHKEKVDKRNKLNLSSNELHHAGLTDFFDRIFQEINLDMLPIYRYYPKDVEQLSELMNIASDRLLFTAGSDEAVKAVMTLVAGHSNSMILQYPNYENYESYARLWDIQVTKVQYDYQEDRYFDFAERFIQTLLKASPSTVVITNPNGFTGYALSLKTMMEIAELCHLHNHILVIDEAYSVYADIDHSILLEKYCNIIIIRSYSKSYGLAGLRFAAVFTSPVLASYLSKWNPMNAINTLSFEVFRRCLENVEVLKGIQNEIIQAREWAKERLSMKYEVLDSRSNFLAIHINNAGEYYNYLLRNGIVVRDISHIPGFKDCLRMTILEKGRMEAVIKLMLNHTKL